MGVYDETAAQWRIRKNFGVDLDEGSPKGDLEKGAYLEELDLFDDYNRESDNNDYRLSLTITPMKRNP